MFGVGRDTEEKGCFFVCLGDSIFAEGRGMGVDGVCVFVCVRFFGVAAGEAGGG